MHCTVHASPTGDGSSSAVCHKNMSVDVGTGIGVVNMTEKAPHLEHGMIFISIFSSFPIVPFFSDQPAALDFH